MVELKNSFERIQETCAEMVAAQNTRREELESELKNRESEVSMLKVEMENLTSSSSSQMRRQMM